MVRECNRVKINTNLNTETINAYYDQFIIKKMENWNQISDRWGDQTIGVAYNKMGERCIP